MRWVHGERYWEKERDRIREDAHLWGGPWHQQGHEGGPHLKDPLLRCYSGGSQHPLSFCRLLHDVSLFNLGREVSRWKAVIISRVILVAKLPVRRSFPSPHDMHSNYLEPHKHINDGCWTLRFTEITRLSSFRTSLSKYSFFQLGIIGKDTLIFPTRNTSFTKPRTMCTLNFYTTKVSPTLEWIFWLG